MAELTEMVKISKQAKQDLLDIKKTEGHSSLDSVIKKKMEEIKKLYAEKELLENKLVYVTGELNSYKFDLNLKIIECIEKEKKIKELEWKLGKYEGDKEE